MFNLLALAIAATLAFMADALAPVGRNFLAILFMVSPDKTVYFLTAGEGFGLGVGLTVGVGETVGVGVVVGEAVGFGVDVGLGVAVGFGVAVGLAEGLGEVFGKGRFTAVVADFVIGLPVVKKLAN